jgi:hypothetical protein
MTLPTYAATSPLVLLIKSMQQRRVGYSNQNRASASICYEFWITNTKVALKVLWCNINVKIILSVLNFFDEKDLHSLIQRNILVYRDKVMNKGRTFLYPYLIQQLSVLNFRLWVNVFVLKIKKQKAWRKNINYQTNILEWFPLNVYYIKPRYTFLFLFVIINVKFVFALTCYMFASVSL